MFSVFARCTLRVLRVDFCPLIVTNVFVFSSSCPPLLGVDVTPFSLFRVFWDLALLFAKLTAYASLSLLISRSLDYDYTKTFSVVVVCYVVVYYV